MGGAAISNWTVCHPVTAKVHKKKKKKAPGATGDKLESVHVVMDHDVPPTTAHSLVDFREDDSSCPLQDRRSASSNVGQVDQAG